MRTLFFSLACLLVVAANAASAQELEPIGVIKLTGEVANPDQLSGITFFRHRMIVCPDEEASFNVLAPAEADTYKALPAIRLHGSEEAEIDMEGAASDDKFVYLVGSHGLARKAVKPERAYEQNRKRFAKIDEHIGTDSLFRLKFEEDGALTSIERISLRGIVKSDDFLKPFNQIPSKENGIDIEGVAAKDGELFLGFRGPVLRDNYVPVMVLQFKHPDEYELRFVGLGGRGIRDITAVEDGFLIIGGPIGDGNESYELYLWDGTDCIPGEDSPGGKVVHLGTLPSDHNLKPEGIAVTGETGAGWEVVVVRDGETNATKFRVHKP